MKNLLYKFLLLVIVISVFSCSNDKETALREKQLSDSLQKEKTKNYFSKISNKEGIIGIFNVPEMLTICKLDSAPMRDISFIVPKAYSVIEKEMNTIGAELDGMPGMLNYSNDTNNFVFECVLPIKNIPKKQPKHCKIVVLEADQMLIYNYFGDYKQLFMAYDVIRKYNTKNNLQQSGPMREFYLSDPTLEKNPAKWQTRIMVPVKKIN